MTLALAFGACSSQMDPNGPAMPPGTTSTPVATVASLDALASVAGRDSLMIIGTNASALVATPDAKVRFYDEGPGTVAAAAVAAHVSVCSVELDALVRPEASDFAPSLSAARLRCDEENLAGMISKLIELKTPMTEVIIGNNAAETWHTTSNGVNMFYDSDILGLLHAARVLDVAVCVVSPSDLALPMYPSGLTSGLSVSDALATCGLPP